MSSDFAIRAEMLGKKYIIGHQERGQVRYVALRDILSQGVKSAVSLGRSRSRMTKEEFWALKDVSFEVKHGEAIGIIGRNGAGKSTLLKLLSRITEPSAGRFRVRGRVASLLEVGTGFHPELTGRENISLNGAILGMTRAEIRRKFDEIVEFAEIEKFLDTPVKRYSSGMYVRLAFAVAAHLEPEILVVDEVLAVGDAQFQRKCLGKMEDVAVRDGRTVIFVSHNLVAVNSLCSRAILLHQGQVVYDGETDEAVRLYSASQGAQTEELRDRIDRQGHGSVRSVSVRIVDETGKPTDTTAMGSSFCVELETEGNLSEGIVGFLIGSSMTMQAIRCFSWEQVNAPLNLEGHNRIKCWFRDFPMMHGTYYLHIWIGRVGEVADFVENALQLTVAPADVYGTGRTPDPRGGMSYCQGTWEMDGAELN